MIYLEWDKDLRPKSWFLRVFLLITGYIMLGIALLLYKVGLSDLPDGIDFKGRRK